MQTDIPNAKYPSANLVVGGQPSAEQLHQAAKNGIKTIVNLRPVGEFNAFDERQLVEDEGMAYVHIPVGGLGDINESAAKTLDTALNGSDSVMVHCASGNRVGALLAYRERTLGNQSAEQALDTGIQTGLNMQSPLYGAMKTLLEKTGT